MDAQTLVIRYRGNSVRVPNAEFVILTEIFKNRGLFVPMSKLSDLIQATPEHLSVRINHLSKLLVQLGLTFQRKWGYGITIVSLPAEGAMLRKHFGTAG